MRAGILFGIPVYLHITILFFLFPALVGGGFGLTLSIEYAVLIVLSILLHELGHALTAKVFGFRGISITIHGFGGFALSSGDRRPKQDLIITLAGPAVTFLLSGICIAGGRYGLLRTTPGETSFLQFALITSLGYVNLVMGFLNLLPMFPFDGGNALKALLNFRMPEFKAMRAVAHLGIVIGPIMLIFGFLTKRDYYVLFGLMGTLTCYSTLLGSGGIRFGEFAADRRLRRQEAEFLRRRQEKNEDFVSDVNARLREREEKERLRKLFESSGMSDE